MIQEGKIKKEKNPSVIFRGSDTLPYNFCEKIGNEIRDISDEIPFDIPNSWEWCRLGDILIKLTDGTHSTPKYTERGTPFISVKDISSGKLDFSNCKHISETEHNALYERCNPTIGDILLTKVGTTGIPVIVDTDKQFSLFVSVALLKFNQELLYNKYLLYMINSPLVQKQATENTKGVGNKNWVMRDIANTLIVIPPIEEQHRIVAKIEELMPYIEKYEQTEKQLTKLNETFPEMLKKSILQQAVQGKLVPQNPDDEPANILLERIRAEKQALIKAGKIKKDKHESVIITRDKIPYEIIDGKERCIADEVPFDIPDNWCWCRWGGLSESIQYGYNAPAKENGRIKMVRISDIQGNKVLWDSVPYCDIDEDIIENYLLKPNDILFARTGGTVGKSYLVKDVPEKAIYAGYLIRTRYSDSLCPEYLKYFMQSELYWIQLRNGTIATAQPNCNGKTLANMLVPLPPLSEQKRIVAKIEEVIQHCNKL